MCVGLIPRPPSTWIAWCCVSPNDDALEREHHFLRRGAGGGGFLTFLKEFCAPAFFEKCVVHPRPAPSRAHFCTFSPFPLLLVHFIVADFLLFVVVFLSVFPFFRARVFLRRAFRLFPSHRDSVAVITSLAAAPRKPPPVVHSACPLASHTDLRVFSVHRMFAILLRPVGSEFLLNFSTHFYDLSNITRINDTSQLLIVASVFRHSFTN